MLETVDLAFLFKTGFPFDHRWAVLMQFHPPDDWPDHGNQGFGGITVHGPNVTIDDPRDSTGTFFLFSTPIVVEQPFRWRLVTKWATDTNGYIKLWDRQANKQLVNWTGITIPQGMAYKYKKQGIYRSGGSTKPAQMVQMRIDVNPGDLTLSSWIDLDAAKKLQATLKQQLSDATATNDQLGTVLAG